MSLYHSGQGGWELQDKKNNQRNRQKTRIRDNLYFLGKNKQLLIYLARVNDNLYNKRYFLQDVSWPLLCSDVMCLYPSGQGGKELQDKKNNQRNQEKTRKRENLCRPTFDVRIYNFSFILQA